jgi:hypothetical protein
MLTECDVLSRYNMATARQWKTQRYLVAINNQPAVIKTVRRVY